MSKASYRALFRAPVRGLWSGALTFDQFFESAQNALEIGLTQAWTQGARSVGIAPDEQTSQDRMNLRGIIVRESSFLARFGEFVEENRRELQPPGQIRQSLTKVYNRVNLWVNRWLDVFNQAVLSGRLDPKLRWDYDPAKENCEDCRRLNGKVKRRSTWTASGIRPQSPFLDCTGRLCGCKFTPTDEPLTRGRLPAI